MGAISQFFKRRDDLKALRLKSHYIKSLDTYLFCSHDLLNATARRYPKFDLAVIAACKDGSLGQIKWLVHSAICQYRDTVQTYLGESVKAVAIEQLDYLMAVHSEEYEEALKHIVDHLTTLKKKVDTINAEQGKE